MRHGLDFVDLQNPQVRRPPVRLEQRIVIGTEMSGGALPMNSGVQHPADVGAVTAPPCTPMPMRRRVNWSITTSTQSLRRTSDSHRKRSTLQRLSVVWPMNDTHDGPVPPGAGRECFDRTRETTCLSMSIPNVCAMMRTIRGQPNRGLRDVRSTVARLSASSGPFGPRLFGHGLDENSRRY